MCRSLKWHQNWMSYKYLHINQPFWILLQKGLDRCQRKMNLVFILTVCSFTSAIVLRDNGYEDVNIVIQDSVVENWKLIERLKVDLLSLTVYLFWFLGRWRVSITIYVLVENVFKSFSTPFWSNSVSGILSKNKRNCTKNMDHPIGE